MRHSRCHFRAAAIALMVAATTAWGQEKNNNDQRGDPPATPTPSAMAVGNPGQAAGDTRDSQGSGQVQADDHPLSGAERYALGSTGLARSFLLAGFMFREVADSNPSISSGQFSFGTAEVFGGQLALQRVWSRYQFTGEYSGGAAYYNRGTGPNSHFHQFGLIQKIDGLRWKLQLSDYFNYLPEAGYGPAGGYGLPVANGPGLPPSLVGTVFNNANNLNPGLTPNQTIYTANGGRFANTSVGDVQYLVSPRGTFTATGSYGLLHFMGSGFINSTSYSASVGYNYKATTKDALGIVYGTNFNRFGGAAYNFYSQSAHLAYGRHVTGRLAFQVSAGPQINRVKSPTSGTFTRISWSLGTSLQYRFQSFNLDVTYAHHATGGGGLLYGADSDDIRVSAGRQITRQWTAAVNGAYARNRAIQQVVGQPANFGYRSWYAGISGSRVLGHYTTLSFNYSLERQYSGACVSGTCGPVFLRHVFGLGFNWNFRPIVLE